MDWNNDGRNDLIFGSGCGYVYYYERLSDGSLMEMPHIQCNGTQIDVGFISCPAVHDWNGDGLQDLLVGREFMDGGSVRLYQNQGTVQNPLFNSYQGLTSNGTIIQKWRSGPQVGDMDGDGVDDLVLAACDTGPFSNAAQQNETQFPTNSGRYDNGPNWGWVHFYKNVGTNQNPVFEGGIELESDGEPIYHWHHNICLYDWNNDGRLDIISGDFYGQLRLYLATEPQGIESNDPQEEKLISVIGSPVGENCVLRLSPQQPGICRVDLYSIDGRNSRILVDESLPAGTTIRTVNLSGLPCGAYILSCRVGTDYRDAEKLIIVY